MLMMMMMMMDDDGGGDDDYDDGDNDDDDVHFRFSPKNPKTVYPKVNVHKLNSSV